MRPFRMRSVLDSLLFLAIATAVNYAWFIHNPAFRDWAWHPYLLIIVLIGLFYGFWESLACLSLCSLFYTSQLVLMGLPVTSLWTGVEARNLFSFLVAALFFGEIGELYRRNIEHFREEAMDALSAREETADENKRLWQANNELQERVKFMDSHLASLRETAGRLLSLDERSLLDGALDFLMKVSGAEGASLYLRDRENNAFWRYAAAGKAPSPPNPASLPASAFPFNRLMENPAVRSVRDSADESAAPALRWLAAMPLLRRGALEGVFFLESMPLLRLTNQLLRDLEAVSEVVNRSLANAVAFQEKSDAVSLGGPLAPKDLFRDLVEKELARARRHKSRASLLSFQIDGFEGHREKGGEDVARFILDRVIQIAGKHKRRTDVLCHEGDGRFSLLMPHTSPDQIHPFVYRTREEAARLSVGGADGERVSLSFGVYGLDEGATDAGQVIHGAERVLRDSLSVSPN